jgi:hypothetical protein
VTKVALRFESGAVRLDQLQAAISDVLDQIADSTSELAAEAERAGIAPAELAGSDVQVTQERKGFGAEAVLITIGISAAGSSVSHVVNKLWDELIWPRLKAKFGADALGKKIPAPDDSGHQTEVDSEQAESDGIK